MEVMMSVSGEKKPEVIRSAEELIMSVENSAPHKELRNIWTVDRKAFETQKWDQEEEVRQLRAEVYHIASMSLIFQGVIFTAVSQTNLLNCSLAWSPILLSAFVGIASMFAVADKLYELGIVKDEINISEANIAALVRMLDRLDKEGAGLDLNDSTPRAVLNLNPNPGLKEVKSWYGLLALFFLFFFSLIISLFSQRTLCHNCKSCP